MIMRRGRRGLIIMVMMVIITMIMTMVIVIVMIVIALIIIIIITRIVTFIIIMMMMTITTTTITTIVIVALMMMIRTILKDVILNFTTYSLRHKQTQACMLIYDSTSKGTQSDNSAINFDGTEMTFVISWLVKWQLSYELWWNWNDFCHQLIGYVTTQLLTVMELKWLLSSDHWSSETLYRSAKRRNMNKPPHWPGGSSVHLESERCGAGFLLAAWGFFQIKSNQWFKNWHSSGCPAKCLLL